VRLAGKLAGRGFVELPIDGQDGITEYRGGIQHVCGTSYLPYGLFG